MEGSQQHPPPWIGTYIPTYHLVVSCVGPTYLHSFLLHNPFVSFRPFLKSRQTLDDWVQNKTRFDPFVIFVIIEWQFVYYFPLPNYYTFVHFDTCLSNNWLILRILFWRIIFSQIFHQIFIFFRKIIVEKKHTFKNFHISENNIISVELVQGLILPICITKSAYPLASNCLLDHKTYLGTIWVPNVIATVFPQFTSLLRCLFPFWPLFFF
jgi:hypothetical protein